MKPLKEIGIEKAAKFIIGSTLMLIFKLIIFPQLRAIFLKLLGAKIGKNVIIHNISFFNYYRLGFKGLQIGNNCFIGDEGLIDLADAVILSDDVTIAERVTILTHMNVGYKDHPLQKHFPAFNKPVIIENGCFVGANVTILPGITIEKCSFIAAGSVVLEDVAPNTLVGGVPAKYIKSLI